MTLCLVSCFAAAGSFTTLPTELPTGIDDYYSLYGAQQAVSSCCSTKSNKALITWRDNNSSNNPWYTIYDFTTGRFATAAQIDISSYSGGVSNNVYCSYNLQTNQALISWLDSFTNVYYAVYSFDINQMSEALAVTSGLGYSDVYSCCTIS